MANRAGKRERQARNRTQRGSTAMLIGGEWKTLKARHRNPEPLKKALEFISFRGTKAAVPVDDRGTAVETDV